MQNGNWGYWLGWTCLDRPLHFPIWRVQWVQWLGSPPSPKTCTSNILTSAAATIRFPWKIQFTRNKWIVFFSGNIKKLWLIQGLTSISILWSDPYFQPFHLLDPKLDYCEEKNGHQYFSVALSSQHFVGSLHNCLPLRKAKTKNRLWFNIIFTSPDYQFMVMVMMSQEKFYNDTGFWRFLLILDGNITLIYFVFWQNDTFGS